MSNSFYVIKLSVPHSSTQQQRVRISNRRNKPFYVQASVQRLAVRKFKGYSPLSFVSVVLHFNPLYNSKPEKRNLLRHERQNYSLTGLGTISLATWRQWKLQRYYSTRRNEMVLKLNRKEMLLGTGCVI